MVVTIDASVLIQAIDAGSTMNGPAAAALAATMNGSEPVVLLPPALVAFVRVTTHPGLMRRPLSLDSAFDAIELLAASDHVSVATWSDDSFRLLRSVATASDAHGKLIHDAEIVALMKQHGVGRIVTSDRDFLRFPGIEVTLVEP